MMRSLALTCGLVLVACGPPKVGGIDAGVVGPKVRVSPEAGPFTGTVTLTFTADQDATVFVSLDGSDPRTTSKGRLQGDSPFTVKLSKTATVKYFASAQGHDGDLAQGTWLRVGSPPGEISGVVVVGAFATKKLVAVSRGPGQLTDLGKPDVPSEIPFTYTDVRSGTYRLIAYSDRNDDGQIMPFIDFNSDPVTVTIDSTDPAKAGAEGVRLYLGSSTTGLGTLRGVVTLPNPPSFQNLQISLLSPDALAAGFDPMALLQQLQGGYRIFTNTTDTEYPYVITNLKPGPYLPVPSLLGFGNGGIALNFLANPLKLATIEADQETVQNHAFGPVNISGQVTVSKATSMPLTALSFGVVAGRVTSLSSGIQAVLMPVILTKDMNTGEAKASYAGSAIRENQTVALRVFLNPQTALVDALTWVVNPFAPQAAHTTLMTQSVDAVKDIAVP